MALKEKMEKLISSLEIQDKINNIAQMINNDYKFKIPLLICVLKGACVFFIDLIRQLIVDIHIDFIELSSYGQKIETSKKVNIMKWLSLDIRNRDIIIVEDIIDTGITCKFLIEKLKKNNPKSIKLCTLINKPSKRIKEVKIDYKGFDVPNKFIVGYGLDLNEKYRNLEDIYYLID
ncbi:MAG: hypoxanthine phosphoribosyltransferase [Candidatus Lokiarchaeota archaeon]|nr:hypoxanthine phosphoribosyltransferase [Candidatus Lokiarchaeota archaeon]